MRANALTVIHKFLRREMFDFSQQLFRAGPEDCAPIRHALESLAELLEQHAAQEDASLEPLLRELDPARAERLAQDHRRLADQLDLLLHAVRQLDSDGADRRDALLRFNLDWNRYLSAYLAHLDDEERTMFPVLEDRIPPIARLAEKARLDGARGQEFLLKLWAVTTCEERMAIESEARGTETVALA